LFFNSKILAKMLKKENGKESQMTSIKNKDGARGQIIKTTINTIESIVIFILPKMFDSR
jgi:hypothetical protein